LHFQRPDPRVAANVLSISLFRFGDDVRSFLNQCGIDETILGCKTNAFRSSTSRTIRMLGSNAEERLDEVAMLYAAETILAKRLEGDVISAAELQLRATFLARLDREQVFSALDYFFLDPSSQPFV
uniref:PSD1 domain-containing protein n=1 Tax=Toxocara canis TaxID=6265 RepID=A0A183U5K3_TOXCA